MSMSTQLRRMGGVEAQLRSCLISVLEKGEQAVERSVEALRYKPEVRGFDSR